MSLLRYNRNKAGNTIKKIFDKFIKLYYNNNIVIIQNTSGMWCKGSTWHLGCWGGVRIVHFRLNQIR